MTVSALFILEVINIGIAVVFLFLFLFRLKHLSHFAQTDKYLNYYPKIRILFAVLYVILSMALLSYNIASKMYAQQDSLYLFAGGGGESINSLVLLLQLYVLRQELKKERPYTPSHMVYFFYLVVISLVRFGLTVAAVSKQQTQEVVDLVLATCLMADSCIQLGYWIAKKQTLPEFEGNHYFSFDEFRSQAVNQPGIISRGDLTFRLQQKSLQHDFPFIKPSVNVQNSKFRIILQILASNTILPPDFDSTDLSKLFLQPSSIQGKNVTKLLKSSISLRQSQHQSNSRQSFHLQIISQHQYNLEQVKQLYILCGRFMLKKQIMFVNMSLRQIAKNLQQFLNQVFEHKSHYQNFLLKFFHVDKELIQIYEEKTKGLDENFVSDRHSTLSQLKPSYYDKNSIYLSVQIYKQLWIEDHYEFYMKISVTQNNAILSYPMRRFSEFEDFDTQLRAVLAEKAKFTSHLYQLPALPKKHLFYMDQDKINHRRVQLELYLRKLANDYVLMELPQIRQIVLKFLNLSSKILHLSPVYEQHFYDKVIVVKGNISKALINNDYVTFYEFKLFRQGIEIRAINKRFSDFIVLNEDINRWMNNIQICYKSIQFPEKHLFKSETHRHEKLKNYLQAIINTKQAHQIYCLNVFLNVAGNAQLSDDTFYSAISFVKSKGKDSSVSWNQAKGFTTEGRQQEFQMQKSPDFSYSMDKKRMSALIDQLGRDDYQ